MVDHADAVNSVAFSPDSKTFASGSGDGTVKLWTFPLMTRADETLIGHTGAIMSVAFSPDGKFLASGSDDQTIKLWEFPSYEAIKTLSTHTGKIRSVAFIPDGRLLCQQEDLDEQILQFWQKCATKCSKRIMVRMHIACDEAECD